ncbi:15721_t:CDS:2, partial [Dentiscutata heterogama]
MNEISEIVILLNSNLLCVDDKDNGEHNIDSHAQSLRNLEWYYKAIDEGRIVKFRYSEFYNLREIGQDYGDQKVALKRFSQNNSIINFANEIKQIYTVNNHENINRFHGITKDPYSGDFIMVLQCAKDGNLRNYLELQWNNNVFTIALTKVINILEQIVQGLKHLHSNNIIHRDLVSDCLMSQYPLHGMKVNVFLHAHIVSKIFAKIIIGGRETPIHGTPKDYVALYQKCWSPEPEQRPNLNEILRCLEEISKKADNKFITYSDRQRRASTPSLTTDNSSSLNSSSDHSEYFSIQSTISRQIFINTTNIITRSQAEKISDWIYGNNIIRCEFRLRYVGSRDRDGTEFKNFHKHCDNLSGTVVVLKVRATGEILGGYNPIMWKMAPRKFGVMPTSKYGVTDKAFIFSFKDEKTIFSKVKNPDKAIYYKDEFATSFGKSDLSLINDMTLNYKWYCKQKNYNKPIRSSAGSFEADDYQIFE